MAIERNNRIEELLIFIESSDDTFILELPRNTAVELYEQIQALKQGHGGSGSPV